MRQRTAALDSYTLPGYFTVDLRLSRIFAVGGGRKGELMLEGFNLPNLTRV